MTSPDMDDEAMKAMAERIVRQCYPETDMACAGDLLKVAYAAIIETRDRDAALADGWGMEGTDEAATADAIAAAIRSGQQFRKDV